METKMCIQCGLEKSINDFYVRKKTNKVYLLCKKCDYIKKKAEERKDKDLLKELSLIRVKNRVSNKQKAIESFKEELQELKIKKMEQYDIADKFKETDVKTCKKCNIEKPISEFHIANSAKDGHFNSCKKCINEKTHNRIIELNKDPEYREKERLRAKERYRNIDPNVKKIKDNVYRYDNDFITRVDVSNARKSFSVPKGYQCHHWNYNVGFELDVIILAFRDHRKIHASILIDRELLIFRTKDGYLLDTKQKHEDYINSIVK